MQNDGMYILPLEVVQKFEQSKLGFNALRLLHGVYHLSYVLAKGSLGAMAIASMRPTIIRASAINKNVGPKGAKDTRHMRDAIAVLEDSGFFLRLGLTGNARGIEYQFSQSFIRATQGPKHPFARLDAARIAECRSETDILFYTLVAMHERQDAPQFLLPCIGGEDPRWSWAGSSERWLVRRKMSGG